MEIKIKITRSTEWVGAMRLQTGENVPERIDITVKPSQLSEYSRSILMRASCGMFRDVSSLAGHEFLCDSDSPSASDMDDVLEDAARREAARDSLKREDDARDAEAKALLKAEKDIAQRYLGATVANLKAQLESERVDNRLLSQIMAAVDPDILQDAARAVWESERDETFGDFLSTIDTASYEKLW